MLIFWRLPLVYCGLSSENRRFIDAGQVLCQSVQEFTGVVVLLTAGQHNLYQ